MGFGGILKAIHPTKPHSNPATALLAFTDKCLWTSVLCPPKAELHIALYLSLP